MAGRGKSFVSMALTHLLRGEKRIVLIAGSTAKSVQSYARGRTMHSLFHINVTEDNSDVHSRLLQKLDHPDAILIRQSSLIILEELPMANVSTMEAIDELLKALGHPALPFGGKCVLAVGDFRQVAPVVPGAYSEMPVFQASVRNSPLWSAFEVLTLHQPIRNAEDPEFCAFVDTIGEGWEITEIDLAPYLEACESDEDGLSYLYPDIDNPALCMDSAFLSPVNVMVDEFNDKALQKLSGDVVTYLSRDAVKEADESLNAFHADIEYLSHLKHTGVPPHALALKQNAICVLMRNLDVSKGLVKNARVYVKALHRHVVEVSLLRENFDPTSTQRFIQSTHFIPRICFVFKPSQLPIRVSRKQFPLRLAYATTFNSCQGLTLQRAVMDLRVPVFAHGQLYTALSRVRNRRGMKTLHLEGDQRSKNVVYRSLLLQSTAS